MRRIVAWPISPKLEALRSVPNRSGTTPPAIDKSPVVIRWIDRKRVEIDRKPVDRFEIDRDLVCSGGYMTLAIPCPRRREIERFAL
jgi:hypothetical protein